MLPITNKEFTDQFSSIEDLRARCLTERMFRTEKSAIYKYTDKENHERVLAVKSTWISPIAKNEFNIGLDLCHTNIVHMFQRYENKNRSYIVMNYIEGVTLDKFIRKRDVKISVKKAEKILSQIFETVCFILKKGIIPLDIHTKNLMIGPKKHITFIDFELYANFRKRNQLMQLSSYVREIVKELLKITRDDSERFIAIVRSIYEHLNLDIDKTVTKEKNLETEIDFYASVTRKVASRSSSKEA